MQSPPGDSQVVRRLRPVHELEHASQAFSMVRPDSTGRTRFIEDPEAFVSEGFNHGIECKAIHYTRCGTYVPHTPYKSVCPAMARGFFGASKLPLTLTPPQIGRAQCRERVGQYV